VHPAFLVIRPAFASELYSGIDPVIKPGIKFEDEIPVFFPGAQKGIIGVNDSCSYNLTV